VAQERERAVGDEVHGGLVAGDQQHAGGRRDVVVAHAAGALVGHEAGEHVVAGGLTVTIGERVEVLRELLVRGQGL